MSLKSEQYIALKRSKELLLNLLDSKKRPKKVSDLRKEVFRCLRHFPPLEEDGKPMFSKD
jgi:hypothetical protein